MAYSCAHKNILLRGIPTILLLHLIKNILLAPIFVNVVCGWIYTDEVHFHRQRRKPAKHVEETYKSNRIFELIIFYVFFLRKF